MPQLNWVLFSRLLALPIVFGLNLLLARLLDKHDFGVWVLLISISSALSLVVGMGVPLWAGKLVAISVVEEKNKFTNVFFASLCHLLIVFVFLFLLNGLFVGFFPDFFSSTWIGFDEIAILTAVLMAVNTLICEMARGIGRLIVASCLETGASVLLFVIACIFLFFHGFQGGRPVEVFELFYLLDACLVLCSLLALWVIYKDSRIFFGFEGKKNLMRERFWRKSWSIGANSLLLCLVSQVDLWVVGWFLGAPQLAIYGLATRISFLSLLSQNSARGLLQARLPSLVVSKDYRGLSQLMHSVARGNFLFSLAIFVSFLIFGRQLAQFFLGDFYIQVWGPCLVLLLGRLVFCLLGQNLILLTLSNHHHGLPRMTFVLLIFFVPVLMVATWLLGIYGAATVSSLFLVIRNLELARKVKQVFGFWPFFVTNR